MKKLLYILLLLTSATAFAQNGRGTNDGYPTGTHTIDGWLKVNKGIVNYRTFVDSLYIVHKQGGNSFGRTDTMGTLDAFGWSLLTNSTLRYNVSSSGAHTVTATTYTINTTTGSWGLAANGVLTLTSSTDQVAGYGNSQSLKTFIFTQSTGDFKTGISFGSSYSNSRSSNHTGNGGAALSYNGFEMLASAIVLRQSNGYYQGSLFSDSEPSTGVGAGYVRIGTPYTIITSTTGRIVGVALNYNENSTYGFKPTSGTASFAAAYVGARINQTGGANGITMGLQILPKELTAADFRGLQIDSVGAHWGIYQAEATAKNHLAGKTKFGTVGTPSSTVDIAGANGYTQLQLRTSYTPTSSADGNGGTGAMAWDDNFIYIRTSGGGWKRTALSTF